MIRQSAGWPRNWGSSPCKGTHFSSLCFLQTGFGANIDSCPMRPGLFPRRQSGQFVKLIIHLSNAQGRNVWVCNSTSTHGFMVWCLIKHRDYLSLLPVIFSFEYKKIFWKSLKRTIACNKISITIFSLYCFGSTSGTTEVISEEFNVYRKCACR